MPSPFSHAIAGVAIVTPFRLRVPHARFWVFGVLCAAIPDIDYLWSTSMRAPDSMYGHRGITHSLVFAIVLAAAVAWGAFPGSYWRGFRMRLWLAFALAGASHGLLDMLTTFSGGVAYFAPFTAERFFFPWRPLAGPSPDWSPPFLVRAPYTIVTEVLCIWVPSLIFILGLRHAEQRAAALARGGGDRHDG